jgi:cell wall-associated NlpC family hydrolase
MSARLRALVALPALLMTVLTTLLGSGLATAPAADAASAKHHHHHHQTSRVDRIIHGRNIALRQLGHPYRYGAAGPKAFDCSGLVYWSYRHAGFSVPRTSSAQAAHSRHIPKSHLRTGDFMFFNDGGGVYHVGIFLRWHKGHAIMLHSPKPGQRVQRAVPWTSSWFAGTLRMG